MSVVTNKFQRLTNILISHELFQNAEKVGVPMRQNKLDSKTWQEWYKKGAKTSLCFFVLLFCFVLFCFVLGIYLGNLFSCTVMVRTLLLGYTVIRKYLL